LLGQQICLQAIRPGQLGTPWQLRWTQGTITDKVWYWNYHLPEETRRGLADQEDLYSPGYLVTTLQPGAVLTLEAGGMVRLATPFSPLDFEQAVQAEQQRFCHDFGLLIDKQPKTEIKHVATTSASWRSVYCLPSQLQDRLSCWLSLVQ